MKTLQELKNKKFNVERIFYSISINEQMELIKKRLQPENFCGDFHKYNDINCLVINNKIVATCKDFFAYNLSNISKDDISSDILFDDFSCTHIDKINRYLLHLKDFQTSFDIIEQKQEKTNGVIEIKSSGAYVFNGIYGDAIKKDDLIKNENGDIIGFKKMTYKNELIEYKFI